MVFFDVIFSGYQLCEVSILNQRFKDHLGHHHQGLMMMMMMMIEMVFETSVQYGHLTRLTTHLHPVPRSKNECSVKSTGTTLPLPVPVTIIRFNKRYKQEFLGRTFQMD